MTYMNNLEALYNNMLHNEVNVQIYNFNSGVIGFNVCFSINETPFVLALTSRTIEPEFFIFNVNKNFEVSDSMDQDSYRRLANLLNQGGYQTLYPRTFLQNLNLQTPSIIGRIPTNQEILAVRRDITEHRDRPYFDTWRHHGNNGNHVSEENKAKTLALLGREAYQYSEEHNASSIWSANPIQR